MNCDQAFDAMTDPDRWDSRELSQHLRSCPRCRQMYETLEPALGLFAAVDGDPAGAPPAVPARSSSAPVRLAQQIAARLSSSTEQHSPRAPQRRGLWGAVFAALTAGVLLSVGIGSFAPHPPAAGPGGASVCTWLHRDAVPRNEEASGVVVACVTCHLSHAVDSEADQSDLREFSRNLDRLVAGWRMNFTPRRGALDCLIACTTPEVGRGAV